MCQNNCPSMRRRRLEVAGERENGREGHTRRVSPTRAPVFSGAHYFQAHAGYNCPKKWTRSPYEPTTGGRLREVPTAGL